MTLSVATRVELVARAVAAGVRRIEAVSFVNPARVPQMAGAEEVMAGVPRDGSVSYIGLVLNRRGLDRALAAGVDEVNVVVVATEEFSRRNQGCSVDEAVAAAQLPARLRTIRAGSTEDGGPRVYLRADRELGYGRVMRVMGELNRADLRRVALVSVDPNG